MKKLFLILSLLVAFTLAQSQVVTQVTTNDTITDAETVYSSSVLLGKLYYVNIQVVCDSLTGNPAGTAKLQGSNDGTNFTDISGKTLSLNGSGTYTTFWELSPGTCKYVRVAYVSTGTATIKLNAWIRATPYK